MKKDHNIIKSISKSLLLEINTFIINVIISKNIYTYLYTIVCASVCVYVARCVNIYKNKLLF
jgi:hypothetical protein